MKGSLVILSLFLTLTLSAVLQAQPITIEHTPFYRFVVDNVNPYEIRATITSTDGTINVRRVYYDAGNGWKMLFMQPTNAPDEYVAYIPAQLLGTRIIYYIRAADSAGNIINDPPEAPGNGLSGHLFRIGHFESVFLYDFESGEQGWVHDVITNEDDWMLGAPNEGGQNPNDPLKAHSGENCWGNDLMGNSVQEGNYSDMTGNYIDSPVMDLTGISNTRLFYRRWLTVEEGIYDTAKVFISGTEVWGNQSYGHHLDVEWVPHELNISAYADNNPATTIRFELTSDQALNYGGWNLDDVEVAYKALEGLWSMSNPSPSLGETVTISVQADANTSWYILSAKRQGQGFYQIPGGPLVWTGLHERSLKHHYTGQTDSSGVGSLVKAIPNRVDLIGKERRLNVIVDRSGLHALASVKVTFNP